MKRVYFRLTVLFCLVVMTGNSVDSGQRPARANQGDPQRTRPDRPFSEWSQYGADLAGTRYSSVSQIDRGNVAGLQMAWTYRTGDVSDGSGPLRPTMFEATPVHFAGKLYLITPFNRVVALNPETGQERWTFDPQIDRSEPNTFAARGVSTWSDSTNPTAPCSRRIFFATLDARLFALNAEDGQPCAEFGQNGVVDLSVGVGPIERDDYLVTSPPLIVNHRVIVGSSIGDNRRVDVEPGVVRAFDARTGLLLWSWDPIPRTPDSPGWETWESAAAMRTGAANAWALMSADRERDLVFIPTGSASPDHYGGERKGDNLFSNSVVALRASSGELVWHFQLVHHDVWDYDVASQPVLTDLRIAGEAVAAVIVMSKMGHVFVLDRESGEPLLPVEERPVPPGQVQGEQLSPTQPFPVVPPPLHPTQLSANDAFGLTEQDRQVCVSKLAALDFQGAFTPPTLGGSLIYPGFGGGTNWGGGALDHRRSLLVVNLTRLAFSLRLIPRAQFPNAVASETDPNVEFGSQTGTPFGMARAPLLSPSGLPCNPPPWGETVALDPSTGEIRWRVPTGPVRALNQVPQSGEWGSITIGGPIATGGGLVFIAGDQSETLRALDIESGEELWKADLPAGAFASPMTYETGSPPRQFVVIAAGGYPNSGTRHGDYVLAYSLAPAIGAK